MVLMAREGWLPSVTKRFDDESDAEKFQFTLYCDCCGERYRTEPIPFSAAGAPDKTEDFTEAQRMIWEAEHEDAYERANQYALITFTPCSDCGRAICEDCAIDWERPVCPDCKKKRTEQEGGRVKENL
jgi:hypothetical protein